MNSTDSTLSDVAPEDLPLGPRYTAIDFLIGLALVLGASVLNALGLNLTKRSHNDAAKLPRSQRSRFSFLGVLGMGLYILSQLVGSSLALQYLRAQWVAPLSSTSLIANLPLARWLCGTSITKLDITGTGVVILGVVGVVGFSNIKRSGSVDEESALDLASLHRLWGRSGWISFFVILQVVSLLILWAASIMADVLREREELEPEQQYDAAERIMRHREEARAEPTLLKRIVATQRVYRKLLKARIEQLLHSRSDVAVRKWSALLWSVGGGALSGQTLVYAKETLKLASNGEPGQFASLLPIVIVLLLASTAIAQIICLNAALAAYHPTLVVPCFFAVYCGVSFLASLIGLDQVDSYSAWVLTLISFSLLVLIAGVIVLSSKKPDAPPKPAEDAEDDAVELNTKRASRQGALLQSETVWEASDEPTLGYAHVDGRNGVDKDDFEEDEDFGELQSPVPLRSTVP